MQPVATESDESNTYAVILPLPKVSLPFVVQLEPNEVNVSSISTAGPVVFTFDVPLTKSLIV